MNVGRLKWQAAVSVVRAAAEPGLRRYLLFVKLKRETRSLSRSSALAIDSAVAPMNDLVCAQLAELHLTLSSATAES